MSAAFERLPSLSASTREMNRRSNSRLASAKRMPFATISSMRRSSRSFTCASFELQAGEELESLHIFLAGPGHDVLRQRRNRRLLVPTDGFEVVAYELLVEAGLGS